ncbi:unnamed protein product, partial [Polarella glacialis]
EIAPSLLHGTGLEAVAEVDCGSCSSGAGQVTLPAHGAGEPGNMPQPAAGALPETSRFVFSHGDVQVAVWQRANDPGQDPFAEDHTGDLVWPTALAFCRYLCDHEPLLQQKR